MATSVTRLRTAIQGYLGVLPGINIREYVGDRVNPDFASETESKPYIVYTQIFGDSIHNMSGVSELARNLFQFDIVTDSQNTADEIQHALRMDMDGFRGIQSGIAIRNVFLKGETSSFQGPTDGTDVPTFVTRLDFDIWYIRDRTVS